jgi:uncharacterized protein (DUF885 family)
LSGSTALIRSVYLLVCLAWAPAQAAAVSDASILHRVENRYFAWRSRNDSLGYPPLDTMARLAEMPAIPDLSYANAVRGARLAGEWLRMLAPLRLSTLDHNDQLSLEVLRRDLNNYVDAPKYYWLEFPISVYGTRLQPIHDILTAYPFRDSRDTDSYLTLIRAYPSVIDGMTVKMRGQLSRGIVMPSPELEKSRRFIASLATAPEATFFYVSVERLGQLPPQRAREFQSGVRSVIERQIIPSLQRMLNFLDGTYKERTPASFGLSQYPGGADYYRWLVRLYTTEDVSPEEVHEKGLDRVRQLEAQLSALGAQLGMAGGIEEICEAVRNDPRFYARSPEEVGARLNAYLRRIEPVIPQYFSKLPRAPYTVQRLRSELEGALTFGYYQDPTRTNPAGVYWYNGSSLDKRSMLSAAALIYHELLPGHHTQHSFQVDSEQLPAFRRFGGSNAFDEGWAVYASRVAGDMGMYSDPYDRLGWIADELMISARLVVDTGMNALGWSRERATAFMAAHTFKSSQEISTETLRYSSDIPGQGLSYAMISDKIVEIREQERADLGSKFDIRRFHDAVLLSGALPMTILADHVHWYLRQSP